MHKDLVEQLADTLDAAERLSGKATSIEECTEAMTALSDARDRLDLLVDEVAARAVLAGASVRSLAEVAGVAPNSLPPRLARSSTLGAYAEDGRVGAEGVARARYDARTGQHQRTTEPAPLTFKPRRTRKDR